MGIELFRGLAALMVLVTHYARFITTGETGLTFLWTGVDLFFVISGFVFAPMVFGQKVDLKPYLLRRFFRIYPLYVVAVIVYFFFSPDDPAKNTYFIKHLFFLHTTSSITEAYFFNPAFWSLPVEIEFYLVLPLLALIGGSRKKLVLLFGISFIFSFVVNLNRGPEIDTFKVLSAHLSGILPEFLVGIFLYYFVHRNYSRLLPQLVALVGVGIIGFGYMAKYGGLEWEEIIWLSAPFNFMCALGYAMIMFPVLRIKNEDYKAPVKSLAIFCGSISYGVYLFHNLIPRILLSLGLEQQGVGFFAFATVLTILCAIVLYKLVENPARLYGRKLSRNMLHGSRETLISPDPKALS